MSDSRYACGPYRSLMSSRAEPSHPCASSSGTLRGPFLWPVESPGRSDSDGRRQTIPRHFHSRLYEQTGKIVLAPYKGKVTGTRITVDSPVQSIF
jgi:hypothetical protein